MTSEENVKIVRASLEAFVREDWSAVLASLDPTIEIDDTDIPDGDEYRGHDAYLQWLDRWNQSWESSTMKDIEVSAGAGNFVLAKFRQVVVGKGSGIEIERDDAMVCEVKDGLVCKLGYYNDQQRATEAAGLT